MRAADVPLPVTPPDTLAHSRGRGCTEPGRRRQPYWLGLPTWISGGRRWTHSPVRASGSDNVTARLARAPRRPVPATARAFRINRTRAGTAGTTLHHRPDRRRVDPLGYRGSTRRPVDRAPLVRFVPLQHMPAATRAARCCHAPGDPASAFRRHRPAPLLVRTSSVARRPCGFSPWRSVAQSPDVADVRAWFVAPGRSVARRAIAADERSGA